MFLHGPVLLSSLAALAPQAFDLDRFVLEELDVAAYELQTLTLPAVAADEIELEVVLDGVRERLVLRAHSVRAEVFELRVERADGSIASVPAPLPATYLGGILGDEGSRAGGGLVAEGLKAIVVASDGRAWYVQPLAEVVPGAPRGTHLVYAHDSLVLPPLFCGGAIRPVPPPGETNAPSGGACLKIAQLAWDCDHETYLANGSSVANTLADIDAVTSALNVYYARDVLIEHVLTNVLVRTAEPDPYSSFDPGGLLDQFVNEWRNNQGAIIRDMAHLATGREVNGNIIGLAYVGVVCNTPWAFGWTQWNLGFGGHVSVAAHELGHNWGAGHCHDPCDIMCGGCPFFGPNTTAIILATRNSVGCLTDGPPYSDPLPPHVLPEFLEIDGEVLIDVLANDFDGNCDPLTIDSFDATSEQGGTITRSIGTGEGGRDELRYSPAAAFQGLDRFVYRIADGTGHVVDGTVTLTLYDDDPDIAAHYKMDELSGSAMLDSSGHGLDGTYIGPPALGAPGVGPDTGTSVGFDGVFDRAEVGNGSPLAGLRKELSVSVWVDPDQVVGQSQIIGNPGAWAFGIRDGGLYFTLNGSTDFTIASDIPTGQWTHVAVVFDASLDVRFYQDGASIGMVPGNAQSGWPGASWYIAGSGGLAQLYDGNIDELQVYDEALTPEEVKALHDNPGLVIERCASPTIYCQTAPNSVGPGASIQAFGSTNIWANDLELVTDLCPPGQFGLYYYGPNAIEAPFGNGFRCVGGAIHRYPVQLVDPFGQAILEIDYQDPPDGSGGIEAGSTWRFQFWYRDPAGGGAAFNLSNGLSATFCP